jgi:hypothetical protein
MHVDNERVFRRPFLRKEDSMDGGPIKSVRTQAVHGLGRERDEATATQDRSRPCDRGGIRQERVDCQDLSHRGHRSVDAAAHRCAPRHAVSTTAGPVVQDAKIPS